MDPQQNQNPNGNQIPTGPVNPVNPVPTPGAQAGVPAVPVFRSFQADLERAKSGNVPPPAPTISIPVPKAVPIAPKETYTTPFAGHVETFHAGGNAQETYEASNVMPAPIPKLDPQIAVDALHKEDALPKFRSFQSDVAGSINTNKTSVIKVALAEQARNRPANTENPKTGIFALALSGILVLGGLMAIGVYFMIKNIPKTPPLPQLDTNVIIPFEATKDIPVTANTTNSILALADLVQNPPEGNYKILKADFQIGTTSIDSSKFFEVSKTSAAPAFVRSLESDFIVGIYNASGTKPFMVFKVKSYDSAFAGMLEWEKNMPEDLKDFLPSDVTAKDFKDIIVKNKDVRALKDSAGNNLLMYSFPDNKTLVITTDQGAMEEIFARLVATKFVR